LLSSRLLNALILGSVLLVAGCDRQSPAPAQGEEGVAGERVGQEGAVIDRSTKGSAMPEFVLSDAAGKELRLSSLKGKPLLVNLWATWCAPCIAELPTLGRLAATGKVRVLTVSQDLPESATRAAPFLAQRGGARLEPWLDTENALSAHYAVRVLPATILYDAKGREVWRVFGPMDWAGSDAAKLLAEAGA
jgi:thiol-disulfide isomerase/thioredoxin